MHLRKFVERTVGYCKGDPDYHFEDDYTVADLLGITHGRMWQILRGLAIRLLVRDTKIPIFCGRRVVIEHGNRISAGRGLILEDGVWINALSENGVHLGHNVTIAKGAILQCTGVIRKKGTGIRVGNNSAIGAQSYIGGQGGVEIGNDVIMGPGVRIFSENHNYSGSDVLIRLQGESRKGVSIGNNCWIGSSVTIVDGARIGDGVVVAAGAVVTGAIPADSVVGGIPARVIRKRCDG